MPRYTVKPGYTHGVGNLRYPDAVELSEVEAAGFLDKLVLIEETVEPFAGYDAMTAAQIVDAVASMDRLGKRSVAVYEAANKNRSTILKVLDGIDD